MNWSDLGFRSHCILSGYFLPKGGSAFPCCLTSPAPGAELSSSGGQRADAAILSKGVCRGNFELLADPGWTDSGWPASRRPSLLLFSQSLGVTAQEAVGGGK